MKNFLGIVLMVMAAVVSAQPADHELLQQSDALAQKENAFLRGIYQAGNRYFQRGDYVAAFREYDYAAWHGSLAAASRLCVLDAYGIGTRPNPLKAIFWCDKVAVAGHDMASVRSYLSDYRLAEQ